MAPRQRWHPSRLGTRLCVLCVASSLAAAYDGDECKQEIMRIWAIPNYNVSGVDNTTLPNYLYSGPVDRLWDRSVVPNNFSQGDPYFVVTQEGCERICKGGAQLNPPQTAISIVFPLTVLLSLPFESSHGGHFWRAVHNTLASTSVWLGSPPTALASALFELHQVGQCSARTRRPRNAGVSAQLQRDAYFVLMCANQFHIPPARADVLLRALFYGLARALSARPDVTGPGAEREQKEMALAARLLGEMAAQLRALQAGNVKRTLVSLGTFVAAFVFASVLAFGDFGESTTIFILSLGLLFCWLPMLVALTCVIPNRVSPERQRELLSRWLYNNAAIEAWFHPPPAVPENVQGVVDMLDVDLEDQGDAITIASRNSHVRRPSSRDAEAIDRDAEAIDRDAEAIEHIDDGDTANGHVTDSRNDGHNAAADNDKKATDPDAGIPWWSPSTPAEDTAPYLVGSLTSHGRSLRHCSLLTSSFLAHTSPTSSTSTAPLSFTASTNTNASNNTEPWTHSTATHHATLIATDLLRGRPPASWYAIATASLGLVWAEALLSFTCDFLTPTVGLGCWSGCALLYAVLSGAAAGANWLVQFVFARRGAAYRMLETKKRWWDVGRWLPGFMEAVAHVGNFVALGWLATITGIIARGSMYTCWCSSVTLSSILDLPWGGYMDLEGFAFYRNHFDVVLPWAACSGIGAALLAVVFVVAGVRWLRCRRLWAVVKEQTGDGGLDDGEVYELNVDVHPVSHAGALPDLSYVWGPSANRRFAVVDYPYPHHEDAWRFPEGIKSLEKQPVEMMSGRIGRTFEDLISFARRLRERYIWIDAMCIPQDEPAVLASQISRMDQICFHGACDIVSLSSGVDDGLPGTSSVSDRNTQQLVELLPNGEHLLARRSVFFGRHEAFFGSHEAFFVCKEMSAKESWNNPHTARDVDPNDSSDRWFGYTIPLPSRRRPAGPARDAELTGRFENVVHMYTGRNLTFASDRHRAFEGLEGRFAESYDVRFLHAHPVSSAPHLTTSLLFGRVDLRDESALVPASGTPWPSWSWLSHPSGVTHTHWANAWYGDPEFLEPGTLVLPEPSPTVLKLRALALDININAWESRRVSVLAVY
ncbi:hypothetical protein B0T26DRAFT_757879 [Lasiosphaeria miniovina]|uniref:Heterokaryon incompatibility domain-containing protein n=1 Tax=Lasiosphaeria miniovina TaxID=1954250 RepID=A0AA39ZQR4_9PEZI|nr:uncharacterized protein B0T26DRAFT_757879 [Lasiosphaeria miniovina]KAK0701906.1 hypothetical protein B0T26DRAFT_757879 [Lasiosphaeria miniovina]